MVSAKVFFLFFIFYFSIATSPLHVKYQFLNLFWFNLVYLKKKGLLFLLNLSFRIKYM